LDGEERLPDAQDAIRWSAKLTPLAKQQGTKKQGTREQGSEIRDQRPEIREQRNGKERN
jgi:hypothetical protein